MLSTRFNLFDLKGTIHSGFVSLSDEKHSYRNRAPIQIEPQLSKCTDQTTLYVHLMCHSA